VTKSNLGFISLDQTQGTYTAPQITGSSTKI
jgi:hypothetical protein